MDNFNFEVWDYVTMVIVVAGACAPGIYQMLKKRETTSISEFLVSGRGLGSCSLMLSMAATGFSALALLSYPNDVYRYGIIVFAYSVSVVIGNVIATILYIPVFYNLRVSSIFEYLEQRFNGKVRRTMSAASMFHDILVTSLIYYSTAVLIEQVCKINLWISIAAMSTVCISYSAIGGFKSIVWTDMWQYIVMSLSLVLILVIGYLNSSGFHEIWRINKSGLRTEFFIFLDNKNLPYTIWTFLIGTTINWVAIFCKQAQLQRSLSCKTLTKSQRTSFGASLFLFAISIAIQSVGLLLYANYHSCDPLKAKRIFRQDQILPLYLTQIFRDRPGFIGFFLAGVICATLSTLSSFNNSTTCLIMEDFVKKRWPHMEENKKVAVSKMTGVAHGICSVVGVLAIQNVDGILKALFIIKGLTYGPVLGFFTIGMISPWTSTIAASIGYVASAAFVAWISIGTLIVKPYIPSPPLSIEGCNRSLYNISYISSSFSYNTSVVSSQVENITKPFVLYTCHPAWYLCWATAIAIFVGLVATIIIGPEDPEKTNPKLIFPWMVKLLNRLPNKIKLRLGFDLNGSAYFPKSITQINLKEKCVDEIHQLQELQMLHKGENEQTLA